MKKIISFLIAFMMVFTYVPATAYATDTSGSAGTSAEISVLDGQILITNDKATGSLKDGVATFTAAGTVLSQDTNTVNVYNKTVKTATLAFDYKVENYKEYTGFDSDNGTFTAIIAAGDSVEFSITGRKANTDATAVLTMSNFSLEAVADASDMTFSYDSALGSITVDGEAVASGTTKTTTYETGLALTATAADGAEFLGWINEATGKIISKEAAFTLKPTASAKVKAVFINDKSAAHYLAGNDFIFTDLDTATSKAATQVKKAVTLLNDVTLTGTNTIPAGVTLLVPFDEENTLYTVTPGATHDAYVTPVAYRTLKLAEGAELIVNGAVSLSAKHYAANGGGRASGSPTGNVSFLTMEKGSSVTIKDGGALYAYGFVTGEGTVTAESGATVYENFQVEDFRGGSVTTFLAMTEAAKGVLPLSQYYVQNIEVPLTLEAGATEYCYTSLFLSSTVFGSSVKFISGTDAMFNLASGSVTKSYDGAADRLNVEGNGDMSLSPITVTMDQQSLDSKAFELPINSNITVDINSGKVDIDQDIALLPGSEIKIAEGATCKLGADVSVYVYDADQWGKYSSSTNTELLPVSYAPGKIYDRTTKDLVDASVEVNGKLDASEGFLYTTTSDDYASGHANIYSTGNGVIDIVSGEQECTYQFTQAGKDGTFTPIYLLPANLVNEDGSFVQTLDATAGTYKYENGTWACSHKVASEKETKAATCTEDGYKTVTCAGDVAHTYIATIPAAHEMTTVTAKAPTCTEIGWAAYEECKNCDYTTYDEIDATGHTPGSAATCTKNQVCTVCNAVLNTATGHSHKAAVTAPTCTEEGYTTYTCACGDSYIADKVTATGHTYGDWIVDKAATCVAEGAKHKVCACGDTVEETIPVLGHDKVSHAAQDATCTEAGWKAYETCSRCDYTTYEAINATGHSHEAVVTAPTCTAKGYTTYTCACGDSYKGDEVKALGHKAKKTTVKATNKKAGSVTSKCTTCKKQLSKITIAKIGKTTISKTKYVYNGKAAKPIVTVKNAKGKKLVKGTDYTVVYKKAVGAKTVTPKAVGKYRVIVTFKGNYKGSVTKNFTINPKATVINKLTKPGKKQIKVTWAKRTAQVTGYEIQCSTTKNFTKKTTKTVKVKKFKTNTTTIKKLKAKKKYWVKIRTYKMVNGKTYYSTWSKAKTIKTK